MGNEIIACAHCQSTFLLNSERLNWRDKDEIKCSICGHILFSWNEAKTYNATLINCGSETTPNQMEIKK
jgi:predicted Zn finger-like uncharacterized protein